MKAPLRFWVIYDHPEDHPEHVVVRKWLTSPVGHMVPGPAELFDSIEAARAEVNQFGRICSPREPEDDRYIVETWW